MAPKFDYNRSKKRKEGSYMKWGLLVSLLLICCISIAGCNAGGNLSSMSEESSLPTESHNRLVDTLPPPRSDSGEESSSLSTSSGGAVSPSSGTPSTSSAAPAPQTVKITFPEGKTFAQMAEMLEEKGVCTKQELLDTINTYDYSYYPLVAAQPYNEHRCFRLEGYLFPATYTFQLNMKPEDVLGMFLRAEEQYVTEEDRQRAAELGYSMDEILTIASLIQGEAGNPNELGKVSSIIHNRLKAGMKLQMDSSIRYVENSVKPYITGDINRYNSYYNTYKCSGLPAGPICNPGKQWITAALYPEDTDYLYFVNDANGNYYYASTHEEHLANCEAAGIPVA